MTVPYLDMSTLLAISAFLHSFCTLLYLLFLVVLIVGIHPTLIDSHTGQRAYSWFEIFYCCVHSQEYYRDETMGMIEARFTEVI